VESDDERFWWKLINEWIIIFIFLAAFIWYLTFTAARLDRLHHRVETSWASLDALLQQRAAIAIEIANLAQADPATSIVLTHSAYLAREAEIAERSDAEQALTEAFAYLYEDDLFPMEHSGLSEKLTAVNRKISAAIGIHRESVTATNAQRKRLVVRIFRLSGSAPLPVTYPFEDIAL
jgi:hypothetical protein